MTSLQIQANQGKGAPYPALNLAVDAGSNGGFGLPESGKSDKVSMCGFRTAFPKTLYKAIVSKITG